MNLQNPKKPVDVGPTQFLYKWNKSYGGFQRKYFTEPTGYRREKAIEGFIILNEFNRVKFLTETDILKDIKTTRGVEDNHNLLVVATQQFSRLPCPIIIEKIKEYLEECPALYLCLTRWYINTNNTYQDQTLDDNFLLAITQWLKKSLPKCDIVDLNLDRQEDGTFFTWVIPDRHYYIRKIHD